MKVSIIYPTARYGGLDILKHSMEHQTHKDLEVIILDELHRFPIEMQSDYVSYNFVTPPVKKPEMFWNLSASLNAGCRVATGELIVLLQDYIWVPPTGIEKYVKKVEQEGPCLITGVGHQYKEPNYVDNPKGEYSCWNQWPGEPHGDLTFFDPRMKDGGFSVCNPVEWEGNWSCFSKEAWTKIGGFDEDFDAGWGYDNVNFSERAQLAGYQLFKDCDNEVKCYSHINLFTEQKHRDESPNNQALWHRKYRDLHKGSRQWKLNYA